MTRSGWLGLAETRKTVGFAFAAAVALDARPLAASRVVGEKDGRLVLEVDEEVWDLT